MSRQLVRAGAINLQNFPLFVHFCNAEALLCNFNAPFHSSLSHIMFKTVFQWRIFLHDARIVEQSFCSVGDVLLQQWRTNCKHHCSNLVQLSAGLLFASW